MLPIRPLKKTFTIQVKPLDPAQPLPPPVHVDCDMQNETGDYDRLLDDLREDFIRVHGFQFSDLPGGYTLDIAPADNSDGRLGAFA